MSLTWTTLENHSAVSLTHGQQHQSNKLPNKRVRNKQTQAKPKPTHKREGGKLSRLRPQLRPSGIAPVPTLGARKRSYWKPIPSTIERARGAWAVRGTLSWVPWFRVLGGDRRRIFLFFWGFSALDATLWRALMRNVDAIFLVRTLRYSFGIHYQVSMWPRLMQIFVAYFMLTRSFHDKSQREVFSL
jgi:hypothetical protein